MGQDKFSLSQPLNLLLNIYLMKGDLEQWEFYVHEGVALTRHTNLPLIVYMAHMDMAHLCLIKGQFSEAELSVQKTINAIKKLAQIKEFKANNTWVSSILAELDSEYDLGYELAVQSYEQSQNSLRLYGALCCIDEYENAIPHLIQAIKENLKYPHLPVLLEIVAYGSLILAFHSNNLIKASMLLGLVFQHSIQLQYLLQHPKLNALHEHLQSNLDEHTFLQAWEHGKTLDLETEAQELLVEFGH